MDKLNLRVKPVDDARGEVVEIYINGRNLIEMVREIEEPFAEREGHPDLAGTYTNIAARVLRPPSMHLDGKPEDDWYTYKGRVEVLSCGACGGSWCWPLSVRIEVRQESIVWRDFVQPHRDDPCIQPVWDYSGFGPFMFDRAEYEQEIKRLRIAN
jgi:hypothetical protein